MKRGFIVAASIALLSWALPVSAQVKLEFRNGRVNLSAQNAPIRTILAEWARLGGTRIVNGEKIGGAPVTLELTGVTERQAMDVLLRNTAGYIIAAREAGATSASSMGSILILATSTAPRQAATPPPASSARTRVPDPEPEPDPEEDPIIDTPPDADSRALTTREANEEAARRRIAARREQIFVGDQAIETPEGNTPTQAAPANPFGLPLGSARPGVITTPPPQSPNTRRTDPEP